MEEVQSLVSCFTSVLSELESRVLSLYLDGRSYEEVGEYLGCDTKTVDNALQRVKRKVGFTWTRGPCRTRPRPELALTPGRQPAGPAQAMVDQMRAGRWRRWASAHAAGRPAGRAGSMRPVVSRTSPAAVGLLLVRRRLLLDRIPNDEEGPDQRDLQHDQQ